LRLNFVRDFALFHFPPLRKLKVVKMFEYSFTPH